MLNFSKKSYDLVSPVSGKVVDLSQVPDEVFAKKLVGDGVAIESTGDIIVSPVKGTLTLIFKTNYGFVITLDNGIEVLVHIGIDTVEMKGKGFERMAQEGDKVKVGDPIIKIDRELIKQNGYSLIIPILITNMENIKGIKYNIDIIAEAGKDKVLTYNIR